MSLRVLFPFIGDTVGGSHISSWQLIWSLPEFDVEPVILLHQGDGYHARWLNDQGARWHVADLPVLYAGCRLDINILKNVKGVLEARRILKDLNIDLVHGNDGRINYAWSFWSRLSGVPLVWHQRSRWSWSRMSRLALPFAKGVISISQFVASGAPVIKRPHVTIYNPIAVQHRDRRQCAKNLRKELGLANDVKLIGCFGNPRRSKRPDTVVEMSTILQRQAYFKFKVLWFGNDQDGILDNLLNTAESTCPIQRIPFRSDVLGAMAGCDTLLASAENDAFGRSLVEAMTVDTPVVASNSGGHKEIIKHGVNGLLFPVGDAEYCAKLIIQLLDDDDLKKQLVHSGRNMAKRFDPKRHANQVANFYRQLLA